MISYEPCPHCGSTENVSHGYSAGCSYDFHWVLCTNDECEDLIESELASIRASDYDSGKAKAYDAWNTYAMNKKYEQLYVWLLAHMGTVEKEARRYVLSDEAFSVPLLKHLHTFIKDKIKSESKEWFIDQKNLIEEKN